MSARSFEDSICLTNYNPQDCNLSILYLHSPIIVMTLPTLLKKTQKLENVKARPTVLFDSFT